MAVLVLCLFAALAAGLVAIYVRLSPLQALQDERTARQGMHEGSGKARATERDELFKRLRSQIRELTETVYLERGIANDRQDQLKVERTASRALVAQLNEERLAVESICLELNADRVDLQDALYRALGRERVERAVREIRASRARGDSTSAQGRKGCALAGEEDTKREGTANAPATPAHEHGAQGQQEAAPSEGPIAPAGDGEMESARLTALPTTPEAMAEHRELVATTTAEDTGPDGGDATRAMSSSVVAKPLQGATGDAEEGDDDPTVTLARDAVDEALGAGAGGTTRAQQTSPRAVRASAVAPPASAPPALPPEPAWRAAGLWEKAATAPVATPPGPPRSGTLVGMPRVTAPAPAAGDAAEEGSAPPAARQGGMVHRIHTRGGDAPPASAPRVGTTLLSMSAQGLVPTPSPSDTEPPRPGPDDHSPTFESLPVFDPQVTTNDGERPWDLNLEPPLYAPRGRTTDEPRHGLNGVPEADPGRHLEPHEQTPQRIPSIRREAGK